MKPELTEQLFVKELVRGSLNVDSEKVDIQKLTGDASTRRYYRASCEGNKYVACLDNPVEREDDSDFVQLQKVFLENGINVPKIIDLNLSSGYLLEEDLGDETFLKNLAKSEDSDFEYKMYENIISELIKIHSIDANQYSDKSFVKRSFDNEKLMFEVDFTFKHFLKGFLGYDDELIPSGLRSHFKKIVNEISNQPKVITHRDFHSRNIMVKNNSNYIIDFQDARMGIPQYDLVSLLDDCYYKVCAKNREALKKYYWDNFLKGKSLQADFDQFQRLYDLTLIQRVFKAIGSFSYIYKLRGDVRYIKYIGFAFEKIRTTLIKYDEFNELRRTLSQLYYDR